MTLTSAERERLHEEYLSSVTLKKEARKCPGCKTQIQKSEGCVMPQFYTFDIFDNTLHDICYYQMQQDDVHCLQCLLLLFLWHTHQRI